MVNLDINRNGLVFLGQLVKGVLDGKIKYNKDLFSLTIKYKDLNEILKQIQRRLKND